MEVPRGNEAPVGPASPYGEEPATATDGGDDSDDEDLSIALRFQQQQQRRRRQKASHGAAKTSARGKRNRTAPSSPSSSSSEASSSSTAERSPDDETIADIFASRRETAVSAARPKARKEGAVRRDATRVKNTQTCSRRPTVLPVGSCAAPLVAEPKEHDLVLHAALERRAVDVHGHVPRDPTKFGRKTRLLSVAWPPAAQQDDSSHSSRHQPGDAAEPADKKSKPSATAGLSRGHLYFPKSIETLLLEHQKIGARFILDHLLLRHDGCILADYMGLGKTLQAVVAISILLGTPSFRQTLLVEVDRFAARLRSAAAGASSSSGGAFGAVDAQIREENDEPSAVGRTEPAATTTTLRVVPTVRSSVKPLRIVVVCPNGVVPHWVEEFLRFTTATRTEALRLWGHAAVAPEASASKRVQSHAFRAFDETAYFVSRDDNGAGDSDLETNVALPSGTSWVFRVTSSTSSSLSQKLRILRLFERTGGVLVIPYSQLVLDGVGSNVPLDVVMLDEGHRIRNEDTQAHRFMQQCRTPFRVVLTGFPLQNRLLDVYRLLDFVSHGAIAREPRFGGLGNEPFFKAHFADPLEEILILQPSARLVVGGSGGGGGGASGTAGNAITTTTAAALSSKVGKRYLTPTAAFRRASLLFAITAPYVLRRGLGLLSTLVGMPRHVYHILLRPTRAQIAAYNTLLSTSRGGGGGGGGGGGAVLSFELVSLVTELFILPLNRVRCASEGLHGAARDFVRDNPALFTDASVPPKMQLLWKLCWAMKRLGKQVVAFSQFHSVLEEIPRAFDELERRELERRNADDGERATSAATRAAGSCGALVVHRCDGLVPVEVRAELCHKFNQGPSCGGADVLIFSLRAGCEGLNLTRAAMVVSLDVSFNPAVEHEAFARAFRLGQQSCVDVVVLSVAGTVEERRFAYQCAKAQAAAVCIDGNAKMLLRQPPQDQLLGQSVSTEEEQEGHLEKEVEEARGDGDVPAPLGPGEIHNRLSVEHVARSGEAAEEVLRRVRKAAQSQLAPSSYLFDILEDPECVTWIARLESVAENDCAVLRGDYASLATLWEGNQLASDELKSAVQIALDELAFEVANPHFRMPPQVGGEEEANRNDVTTTTAAEPPLGSLDYEDDFNFNAMASSHGGYLPPEEYSADGGGVRDSAEVGVRFVAFASDFSNAEVALPNASLASDRNDPSTTWAGVDDDFAFD